MQHKEHSMMGQKREDQFHVLDNGTQCVEFEKHKISQMVNCHHPSQSIDEKAEDNRAGRSDTFKVTSH